MLDRVLPYEQSSQGCGACLLHTLLIHILQKDMEHEMWDFSHPGSELRVLTCSLADD